MPEPDLDAVFQRMGVGVFHHPRDWWQQLPAHFVDKAFRFGALESKKLGPRGGVRWAIASAESWERMKAWRAFLALGGRTRKGQLFGPENSG